MALHDPLIGALLDNRYRVEQRIATGGMSTVYRGTDTRLDRVVALKVMHPSLAGDEGFTARFIREAKAVARLSHPNVVNVFDQGADGGNVFLAMEYVPGRTLRDLLRDHGALSVRAALDVMEPVLAALGAAHRAGLVHRDVKPENVLITEDGLVKVADFGLVRVLGSADGAPTSTTTATGGTVMGTVSYLAPEQILPDAPTDQRVDVYAAGILLYEMLTGRRPHTGDNPVQVMYKHLHEDVPAPSLIAPAVGPELDAIVAGACARAADARPHDAVELLAALQRLRRTLAPQELDAEPPASTRPSPTYPTGEPTSVLRPPRAADAPPPERTSVLDVPPELMDQLLTEPRPYDEPTPARERRPGLLSRLPRRPLVWAAALTALVLAIGGATYGLSQGLYGSVPGVLGKDRAETQRILDKEGLHGRFVEAFSESVPSGQVISTDPGVGARTRRSDTITVTVSKGPKRIAVPDLVGKSAADAAAALAGASLTKGAVTETYNDAVPEGSVISSSPAAGQLLQENAAVSLVVSKGMVSVPDVSGMTKDEAQKALQSAGFTMQTSGWDVFGAVKASGQSPAAGERRPQRSTVTVRFSLF
ncbi:Stk1 family PASTA domain-containing Ser/Thr kinase [Streptomyces sp. NRRL S-350]|uniref:Stk1 family PASTA domain-containing Ser/Thr kinase n=1 Tax=Streptomyces sp. NRRL S-350 TaxID=1463902 RepID=UPI00068C3CB7|nr:Stk1 family PASTA domain-containing Ser/Thr kinase [Streptomyces sp. NRRL S-350]